MKAQTDRQIDTWECRYEPIANDVLLPLSPVCLAVCLHDFLTSLLRCLVFPVVFVPLSWPQYRKQRVWSFFWQVESVLNYMAVILFESDVHIS